MPAPDDSFDRWLAALERRHLADLRFSDVRRALQALGDLQNHIAEIKRAVPFDIELSIDENPPEIRTCDNCGRILYMEPKTEASQAT